LVEVLVAIDGAAPLPLQGIRIVSLALNLPGPAALMRLRAMGADCVKVHSPAGDPMAQYSSAAYAQLHAGVRTLTLDLKTPQGQAALHTELAQAKVLLTSFRPSALRKLGLDWDTLHAAYPQLSMVSIVGSPGARAEEPGHDLTYLAEQGLVTDTTLPATLYADMAGALMATQAVLQAVLVHSLHGVATHAQVALSDAAAHLALPRVWGLTANSAEASSYAAGKPSSYAAGKPSSQAVAIVGGAHAGYRVYACADGRVAAAALEPHFAAALCRVAGWPIEGATGQPGVEVSSPTTMQPTVQITAQPTAEPMKPTEHNAQAITSTMLLPSTAQALTVFFSTRSCQQLDALAVQHDIPLFCMPNQPVTQVKPAQAAI
jgi:alpha-methylacyl-CoA racemase